MIPKLRSAVYVGGYTIHVRFADGTESDVDLESEIWGDVFEPLEDAEVFRTFVLDEGLNTITWPSGADLAPEFLYEKAARWTGTVDGPPAGR